MFFFVRFFFYSIRFDSLSVPYYVYLYSSAYLSIEQRSKSITGKKRRKSTRRVIYLSLLSLYSFFWNNNNNITHKYKKGKKKTPTKKEWWYININVELCWLHKCCVDKWWFFFFFFSFSSLFNRIHQLKSEKGLINFCFLSLFITISSFWNLENEKFLPILN